MKDKHIFLKLTACGRPVFVRASDIIAIEKESDEGAIVRTATVEGSQWVKETPEQIIYAYCETLKMPIGKNSLYVTDVAKINKGV